MHGKARDFRIRSFVSGEDNVLAIEIKTRKAQPVSVTLESPTVRPDPGKRRVRCAGNTFSSTSTRDFGFVTCLAGRTLGADVKSFRRFRDCVSFKLQAGADSDVILLFTVTTSYDAPDGNVRQRATQVLQDAERAGLQEIAKKHKTWWHEFWRKSSIEIDDRVVEKLWYVNQYALACTNGHGQKKPQPDASGICGLYMGEDEPGWGNGWFDDEVELYQWPHYQSNHLELAVPFVNGVRSRHAPAKETAETVYGMRGAEFGPLSRKCVGPWYCQHLWWHYLYSQDKAYLAGTAYPIMRDVGLFFRDYLRKDKNGRYDGYPSSSPEQGGEGNRNITIDLALLKYLYRSLVEAEEILKTPGGDKMWKAILGRLHDYPVGVSHGRKVLRDSGELSAVRAVRHASLLMPIFPIDEITGKIAGNTVRNVSERIELLCLQNWVACAFARVGQGDRAIEYLYDKLINLKTWENGLFFQRTPFFAQRLAMPPRERDDPVCQAMIPASGSFVAAVNEMLMCGLGSRQIDVFRGCPKAWKNARFLKFLAPGGFEVSAEKRKGAIQYVEIRSLRGNACRVVNPFPGRTIAVKNVGTGAVVRTTAAGALTFRTTEGASYLITLAQRRLPPPSPTSRRNARRTILTWTAKAGYQLSLGMNERVGAQRTWDEFAHGFFFDSVWVLDKRHTAARGKGKASSRFHIELPQGRYDMVGRRGEAGLIKSVGDHGGGSEGAA